MRKSSDFSQDQLPTESAINTGSAPAKHVPFKFKEFLLLLIFLVVSLNFLLTVKYPLQDPSFLDIDVNTQVTVTIKSFERPGCVLRAIKNIRRYYPDIKIIVADDSSEAPILENVKLIKLPHKSGTAFGRNEMVDAVDTPYFMTVDDDFVFGPDTRIEHLLAVAFELGADIVAANLEERGQTRGYDSMFIKDGQLFVYPNATLFDESYKGCIRTNFVPQFFIGKTSSLRTCKWDPFLKTFDHEDFILNTWAKNLLIYSCPRVIAFHNPNSGECQNTEKYLENRMNTKDFVIYTMKKWNFDRIEENYMFWEMNGTDVVEYKNEWKAVENKDQIRKVAERAIFLYNLNQENWMKLDVKSAWGAWEQNIGTLGWFRNVWVDTIYRRPSQFDRGEGRPVHERTIKLTYREEPDDIALQLKFSHFKWSHVIDPSRKIYVIMALRDNADSFIQWVNRLKYIYDNFDTHFIAIVADFSSEDIDVDSFLRTSGIPYRLIVLPGGRFCRSLALNTAIDSITEEENPLILVVDASIYLPIDFFDKVRFHVVPEKKVWFPIYNGIYNGSELNSPAKKTYWIDYGFGQAAFYKDDFIKIGKFNQEKWGCRWGAEDVDIEDRFNEAGFVVHRTYEYELFHIPHPRPGGYKKVKNAYDKDEPKCPHTVIESPEFIKKFSLAFLKEKGSRAPSGFIVKKVFTHWHESRTKHFEVLFQHKNFAYKHYVEFYKCDFVPVIWDATFMEPFTGPKIPKYLSRADFTEGKSPDENFPFLILSEKQSNSLLSAEPDLFQWKTCAVIKSNSLTGHKKGEEIDSYEAVLRVNDDDGSEVDIGKKTTILHWDPTFITAHLEEKNILPKELEAEVILTHFWDEPSWNRILTLENQAPSLINKIRVLNPNFKEPGYEKWREETLRGKPSTTDWTIVVFAKYYCEAVTLFGFTEPSDPTSIEFLEYQVFKKWDEKKEMALSRY